MGISRLVEIFRSHFCFITVLFAIVFFYCDKRTRVDKYKNFVINKGYLETISCTTSQESLIVSFYSGAAELRTLELPLLVDSLERKYPQGLSDHIRGQRHTNNGNNRRHSHNYPSRSHIRVRASGRRPFALLATYSSQFQPLS